MKLKKVLSICKTNGLYYLYDRIDRSGEITQWLGDGYALYPLDGLPILDEESFCAVFDIPPPRSPQLPPPRQSGPHSPAKPKNLKTRIAEVPFYFPLSSLSAIFKIPTIASRMFASVFAVMDRTRAMSRSSSAAASGYPVGCFHAGRSPDRNRHCIWLPGVKERYL